MFKRTLETIPKIISLMQPDYAVRIMPSFFQMFPHSETKLKIGRTKEKFSIVGGSQINLPEMHLHWDTSVAAETNYVALHKLEEILYLDDYE